MPPKKMSPTDQKRYSDMMLSATETLMAFRYPELVKTILPSEWSDISIEPIQEKTRVTLRIDADVAKFFRKLGRGIYQDQINLVLRTFMLARLTEILGTHDELVLADTDEIGKLRISHEASLLEKLAALRRKRVGFGG
jgi:uncharacterized protein (DUF4415 family)